MDPRALLEDAILHVRQVLATYNGRARQFSPQALGWKGIELRVIAYVVSGRLSSRGTHAQLMSDPWVCFTVSALCNLTLMDGAGVVARLPAGATEWIDEVIVQTRTVTPRRSARVESDRRDPSRGHPQRPPEEEP